jgi:hypothetical protein
MHSDGRSSGTGLEVRITLTDESKSNEVRKAKQFAVRLFVALVDGVDHDVCASALQVTQNHAERLLEFLEVPLRGGENRSAVDIAEEAWIPDCLGAVIFGSHFALAVIFGYTRAKRTE